MTSKLACFGLEVLQRDVSLLGHLVVDDGVALAERAAADILAGQADREALDQQRGEGQMLGGRPVDALRRPRSPCAAAG